MVSGDPGVTRGPLASVSGCGRADAFLLHRTVPSGTNRARPVGRSRRRMVMTARSPRDDDDLDPTEALDELADDEEELDGFSDVEDDDLDFDGDDELEDDALDSDELDDELDEGAEELEEGIGELASVEDPNSLLDDEAVIAAAVVEDDDDDEDELRDGEFVCRSCFMAKRESALADPGRMLCRDCA